MKNQELIRLGKYSVVLCQGSKEISVCFRCDIGNETGGSTENVFVVRLR